MKYKTKNFEIKKQKYWNKIQKWKKKKNQMYGAGLSSCEFSSRHTGKGIKNKLKIINDWLIMHWTLTWCVFAIKRNEMFAAIFIINNMLYLHITYKRQKKLKQT